MFSLSAIIAKNVLRMKDISFNDPFNLIKTSILIQEKWERENKDIISNMSEFLNEIKETYQKK